MSIKGTNYIIVTKEEKEEDIIVRLFYLDSLSDEGFIGDPCQRKWKKSSHSDSGKNNLAKYVPRFLLIENVGYLRRKVKVANFTTLACLLVNDVIRILFLNFVTKFLFPYHLTKKIILSYRDSQK